MLIFAACSMTTEFWNNRYGREDYAYGVEPNRFLAQELLKIKPGSILFAAEGEGRNAVFAAAHGWQVWAFDQSVEGRAKALKLAKNQKVEIEYSIAQAADIEYNTHQFDAVALIYAHFDSTTRALLNSRILKWLKPGGTLLLEGFAKKHEEYQRKNPGAGGPRDASMLFDLAELCDQFSQLDFSISEEVEIELSEGPFHQGEAWVARLAGTLKNS